MNVLSVLWSEMMTRERERAAEEEELVDNLWNDVSECTTTEGHTHSSTFGHNTN